MRPRSSRPRGTLANIPCANLLLYVARTSQTLLLPADEKVDQYISSMALGVGLSNGTVMCLLALLSWYMTISKEIRDAVRAHFALASVPAGHPTKIVHEGEGIYRIVQLSPTRKLLRELISLLRLVITFLLTSQATPFLVYSIDLGDLMMNAVALEFVLSLDELIYDSLVPQRVRRVVSNTVGLTQQLETWRGIDSRAVLALVCVVGQLMWAVPSFLTPQLDILDAVHRAICSGDRDFIFSIDVLGSLTWGYPDSIDHDHNGPAFIPYIPDPDGYQTLTFQQRIVESILVGHGRGSCPEAQCYYLDQAFPVVLRTNERARCCDPQFTKAPHISNGPFSVRSKAQATVERVSSGVNPSCANTLDFGLYSYAALSKAQFGQSIAGSAEAEDTEGQNVVDDLSRCGGFCPAELPLCREGQWEGPFFNDSIRGTFSCRDARCADVQPYCHQSIEAGLRARALCPQTCGCDQPRSALALSLPRNGCPERCKSTAAYKAAIAGLPCEDLPTSDPSFSAFLDNWEVAATSWPKDWRATGTNYARILRKVGCAYFRMTSPPGASYNITDLSWSPDMFGLDVNPCVEGNFYYPIKPLSIFCPVSCGCRSGDNDCPDSCPRRSVPYVVNASSHAVDYSGLEPRYIIPASRDVAEPLSFGGA